MADNAYTVGKIRKEWGSNRVHVTVIVPGTDGGDETIDVTAATETELRAAIPYAVSTSRLEGSLSRLNRASIQRKFAWRALSDIGRDRIRDLGATFSIHAPRSRRGRGET